MVNQQNTPINLNQLYSVSDAIKVLANPYLEKETQFLKIIFPIFIEERGLKVGEIKLSDYLQIAKNSGFRFPESLKHLEEGFYPEKDSPIDLYKAYLSTASFDSAAAARIILGMQNFENLDINFAGCIYFPEADNYAIESLAGCLKNHFSKKKIERPELQHLVRFAKKTKVGFYHSALVLDYSKQKGLPEAQLNAFLERHRSKIEIGEIAVKKGSKKVQNIHDIFKDKYPDRECSVRIMQAAISKLEIKTPLGNKRKT